MSNTELEIIKGLKEENNSVILKLYQEVKPMAFKVLTGMGAKQEDIEDLIQDGLVGLIENLRHNKYKGESKVTTYLLSIIKYKFLNLKRAVKNKHTEDLANHDIATDDQLDILGDKAYQIKESRLQTIETQMKELSDECREIIKSFYYKNLKMVDIAKSLNYTDSFVRVKKNRCMNKLKELSFKM